MNSRYLRDLAERVFATAVEAALGVLVLAPKLDMAVTKQALTVLVITGLAAAKSVLAKYVGSDQTAALLPADGPGLEQRFAVAVDAVTAGIARALKEAGAAATRPAEAGDVERETKKRLAALGRPPSAGNPPIH